jgi:hypothetical protein
LETRPKWQYLQQAIAKVEALSAVQAAEEARIQAVKVAAAKVVAEESLALQDKGKGKGGGKPNSHSHQADYKVFTRLFDSTKKTDQSTIDYINTDRKNLFVLFMETGKDPDMFFSLVMKRKQLKDLRVVHDM